ncbi:MAG: transglycosylase SLT domain-containing protein [Mycobacteriaceae bacterium]|nr:transglycosylase SLT domain-containing protein [Mycobacteriaceae bacterium]
MSALSSALQSGRSVVGSGQADYSADTAKVSALADTYLNAARSLSATRSGGGSSRADSGSGESVRLTAATKDSSTPNSLDGVINAALDKLGIRDPAARARWRKGYRTLIQRESGGNANAVNRTDSNAVAGHPSRGLTQMIPSTFAANHVRGTSRSITDPVANVAASMQYVMRRYSVSRDGSNLTSNVQMADSRRPPKGY